MWTVGAIFAVAASCSAVLFFVGAVLAISFERRKYRKYTDRRFAGRPCMTEKEVGGPARSFDGHSDCLVRVGTLETSCSTRTRTTSPDGGTDAAEGIESSSESRKASNITRQISLRSRLRDSRTGRCSGRRRLKKRCLISLKRPSLYHVKSVSNKDRLTWQNGFNLDDAASWPFDSSHSKSKDIEKIFKHVDRGNAVDTGLFRDRERDTSVLPRVIERTLGQTCGRSGSVFLAPSGPLPAIPEDDSDDDVDCDSRRNTLPLSIDSTNTSVLRLSSGMEFDAIIQTTQTMSRVSIGPAANISPTTSGRDLAGVESTGIGHALQCPTSEVVLPPDWPNAYDMKSVQCKRTTVLTLSSYQADNDPFMDNQTARLSQSSYTLPVNNLRHQHKSLNEESSRVVQAEELQIGKHTPEANGLSKTTEHTPRSCSLTNHNPHYVTKKALTQVATQDSVQAKTTIYRVTTQSLDPLLGCEQLSTDNENHVKSASLPQARLEWNIQSPIMESPHVSLPSSPLRSYYSPILPSPAYTPTNLHAEPKRVRIIGPRSPPQGFRNSLRLRCRLPLQHRYECICSFDRSNGKDTTAIHRSVQMLRNMHSQTFLPASSSTSCLTTDKIRINPRGRSRSRERDSLKTTKHHTLKDICIDVVPVSLVSCGSPLGLNIGLITPQSPSSKSIAAVSIWEDESVVECSPEPDEVNKQLEFLSMTINTTHKRIQSCEIDERSVGNTKGAEVMLQHLSEDFPDPGFRVIDKVVPSTPQSMYDESGFLKE